jgi:hypothetical protein
LLCAALPLTAQQPAGPPPVLRIFREDIKEAKGLAHEKTEAAVMQAMARLNYPSRILGLETLTGTPQAWFLEGHTTFASIAESGAALDNPEITALTTTDEESLTGSRSMIAVLRPDLSFGTDQINLPKVRFFNIITIRIRAGQEQEFTEVGKMMVGAAAKSGSGQPVATYQVVSGAPNGTFLLMEPAESLKSMDEAPQRTQAVYQALGDTGMKRLSKASADTIANEESVLFAVNPEMSYPAKEWVTADPGFWGPKAVTVTKAPKKKGSKIGEKTAAK